MRSAITAAHRVTMPKNAPLTTRPMNSDSPSSAAATAPAAQPSSTPSQGESGSPGGSMPLAASAAT